LTGSYNQQRERYAGTTPGTFEAFSSRHMKILEILAAQKPHKLLDVGCGDGRFAAFLSESIGIAEVCGVDISESAVSEARKRGISAVKADLDRDGLPFPDEQFDAVLAGEVIEHVYDPDFFLSELRRILRVNGLLVLSTPNLAALHNRISLLLGFEPFCMNPSLRRPLGHILEMKGHGDLVPSGDHIRTMTLRSLVRLLREHRFGIVSITGSSAIGGAGASRVWDDLTQSGRSRGLIFLIWRVLQLTESVLSKFPPISFRVIVAAHAKDTPGPAA